MTTALATTNLSCHMLLHPLASCQVPMQIKPILNLQFPKMCSFVGMVDICRAFWEGCADVVASSTALSGHSKGNLHPTPELTKAFIIAEKVPPAFSDPDTRHLMSTRQPETVGFVLSSNKAATPLCPHLKNHLLPNSTLCF